MVLMQQKKNQFHWRWASVYVESIYDSLHMWYLHNKLQTRDGAYICLAHIVLRYNLRVIRNTNRQILGGLVGGGSRLCSWFTKA